MGYGEAMRGCGISFEIRTCLSTEEAVRAAQV